MADAPETPIIVNASPVLTQVNTLLRDLALVAAAIPTLKLLIGKRDLMGLINWAVSTEAAPVIGVAVTAAVIGWRQMHARWSRAEKVLLANAAPDNVAIVTGEARVGEGGVP